MDKPRLSLEVSIIPDQEEKIIAESIFEQKYKNGRLSKSEKGQVAQEKTRKFAVKKRKELDPNGPEDKHRIVQCIMFVMGIIHLLPFTFFITANEYWMYKFRNVTSNSTDANDRTYLQANFASLNHLISVGPSTVFSFFVIFLGHKIETRTRIIVALVVNSLVFVVETTFVKINTDDWQVGFFALTVTLMLVLSCSMTFSSSANMTVVSKFPDEYMKMYMIGEGIAGLFSALLRLLSIAVAPSTEGAALIYFVTGTTIMTVSSFLFYLSTHTDFFKYYTKDMKEDTKRRIPRLSEFVDVLRYTWPLLILSVVGILIPQGSITNLIVSEYYGTDNVWGTKYFITVITYLLNSVCGIAGRLLFYVCEIDLSFPLLYVVSLGREIIFTPLLALCNAKPRHHLPVIFGHDWQYAIIAGTQSFTGGYFMNISYLKNLRIVPPEKLELSWMVNMFVMKIAGIATSPLGVVAVSLL
ncbi:equilibrative nucleoside transporter 3-like [Sitophilus oryzae]|uniref:Equilibrative nucleoside transporter 3-like n=1 Tax=Sitophilus oryzae TaxID=7048 RepID=A0A6J2YCM0_SITOR|nr:equilibrative nucleoside transporter 3-like [Sitophilus oryzae]